MQIGESYNPKGLFTGVFIPESMARLPNETLSPGAKLLFGRLCWHVNDNGECFPSRPTLAKEIGVSESSVRDYLRELEDQGFVKRLRNGPHANDYEFPWHASLENCLRRKDRQPSVDQQKKTDSRVSEDGQPSVGAYKERVLREDLRENTPYSPSFEDLPITESSARWISQRFKDAGRKLNTTEKRSLVGALIDAGRTESATEVVVACFLQDEYWRDLKFPPMALVKQFQKYLDLATDSATQDAPPPTDRPSPPPDAPSSQPATSAPHWRVPYIERWNETVRVAPVSEWDADDDKLLSYAAEEADFVARFTEICTQAQKIHANDPACGWLTLQWILRIPKGETSRNWRKLFKGLAWKATPQMSRSGQGQRVDIEELTRISLEKRRKRESGEE